jgi:hypothetical protein
MRNKTLFYVLSWTWGIIMTFIGAIVALALIITGHKPKKWGYCYYFEVGQGWGGVELGMFFLTNKNASRHIRNHELGHGLQNCEWGPLMPFVICIPSAIRYWYREIRSRKGLKNKTKYDDIWFEGDATKRGNEFMAWYNKETDNA